jgi:hypothetical protein
MKAVWWMIAAGAACWVGLVLLIGEEGVVDASLGLAGPLVAAGVSWTLTERVYRRNPAGLTPLMVRVFYVKLLAFLAYVAVVLSLLSRRPVSFVLSFTTCFIALHMMEAVWLRRLFSEDRRGAS